MKTAPHIQRVNSARDDLRTEREAREVMEAALKEAPRFQHKRLQQKPVIDFELIVLVIRCIIWITLGIALAWGFVS